MQDISMGQPNEQRLTWMTLALVVFPMAEILCFIGALKTSTSHLFAMASLCLLVGIALCFSVHVTFHEAVHQRWFGKPVPEVIAHSLMTLLMGLPFDGYRCHHFNHHKFNNTLEDYSCTWRKTANGIVPQAWWAYVLGWPAQLLRSKRMMDQEETEGKLPGHLLKLMIWERTLLVAFLALLTYFSLRCAVSYIVCVYAGWAFVALENYAQHPPLQYGVDTTMSYYDALYNFVFCKNGLHVEHHRTASIPWYKLTPTASSQAITRPYLLQPLSRKFRTALFQG